MNRNDKLINVAIEIKHEEHVRKTLQCLNLFSMYWKAEKCQSGAWEVAFLAYVITPNEVGMESEWISPHRY